MRGGIINSDLKRLTSVLYVLNEKTKTPVTPLWETRIPSANYAGIV